MAARAPLHLGPCRHLQAAPATLGGPRRRRHSPEVQPELRAPNEAECRAARGVTPRHLGVTGARSGRLFRCLQGASGGLGATAEKWSEALKAAELQRRPLPKRLAQAAHPLGTWDRYAQARKRRQLVWAGIRAGIGTLPKPILSFQEVRAKGLHRAYLVWSRICLLVPGGLQVALDRMEAMTPGLGQRHFLRMMTSWSHRTLLARASGLLAYKEWFEERWPGQSWVQAVDGPDQRVFIHAVVADYIHELMDLGVSSGVPRTRLADLRFANGILRPAVPWPADAKDLERAAAGYFREGTHEPREGYYYALADLRKLAVGARELPTPQERVYARAELIKFLAVLRMDDVLWSKPAHWQVQQTTRTRTARFAGTSSKTKSTQATAGRLPEGMPWLGPLQDFGVETPWWADCLEDMEALGMTLEHEYLLPSPGNVLRGARPPGAASPEEAVSMLRRVLRACGIEQAHLCKAHSAKQSAMRLVNCYVGAVDLQPREKDILAHHRITGPDKTAAAYNPQELEAPVAKFDIVVQEWVGGLYVLPEAHPHGSAPTQHQQTSRAPEVDAVRVQPGQVVAPEAEELELPEPAAADAGDEGSDGEREAQQAAQVLQTKVARHLARAAERQEAQDGGPSGLVCGYITSRLWGDRTAPRGVRCYHLMVRADRSLNLPFRDPKKERVNLCVNGRKLEVLCDWPLHKAPQGAWNRPIFRTDAPVHEGRTLCKRCAGRERCWVLQQRGQLTLASTSGAKRARE